MTTTKQYITITAGPSREELFDALKYAHDKVLSFRVEFTGIRAQQTGTVHQDLAHTKLTMKVTGITHEDSTGQSFIITARMLVLPHGMKTVKFRYNARTRTGHIDVA